ncbi:Serine/threonine-protein kinase PrkC [Luteitalea pratensis]|uniref:Serine/threonine-protein kinase PrkC n=1 Tax=Luteitalea pratensis TaxID=1855912 RepID=A0A143PKS4_LUTPR|nr:serine/threonine-protein kinase [Luteitalea pratensis]AMY09165.1 Serine/threonine-protein kinase PrkC [Luteitalea pratensis]
MADKQLDKRLGATVVTPSAAGHPGRIGRYVIERLLGQGGMGVVYAAHDDRLQRTIAVKTLSPRADDEAARKRLWREARAAASVNHPNICQIYEVGEDNGRVFIAMELLDGEALSERLHRGPFRASEVLPIGLGILAALAAMHARGVVHRDLKPSNVFLTAHGVKLLDFGLARPELEAGLSPDARLTGTGIVMGTPGYMSPEQVIGEPVDARSDLFAAGAILFEMLAGYPAFNGRMLAEVFHATRYEQPPALSGSPAVAAIDRVIRRALAKRAAERPASAEAMAQELEAIPAAATSTAATGARALTRLVVLPFRILRQDPETDFLAFSLPDAIATSLSRNPALVVRSSAVAARFGMDSPVLKELAAEADVDRVVMGTLMRAGDHIRAVAQLVEAPAGTLLASHVVQSSMGELFQLQDEIALRVCEALALPLSGGQMAPAADAPNDARAYELFLRANELARTYDGLAAARDLYLRCLALDSRFAPAWAHVGRCHRVIGKYIDGAVDSEARAEDAFRRALALSPRLSIAHKFYAQLEADIGHAEAAMVRLLDEANRHGNDPELFAGLVHACRYCGLYEQAIAAHAEARRLDPNVPTSLEQTLLMMGDIDRLVAITPPPVIAGADDGIHVIGLGLAGRRVEARQKLLAMRDASRIPVFEAWIEYLMAWLDRRGEEMTGRARTFSGLKINDDPEAIFQEGWLLCDIGDHEAGLGRLLRAVAKGYYVSPTLTTRPQFDALRDNAEFRALVGHAEAGRQRARALFRQAGGDRLIGA